MRDERRRRVRNGEIWQCGRGKLNHQPLAIANETCLALSHLLTTPPGRFGCLPPQPPKPDQTMPHGWCWEGGGMPHDLRYRAAANRLIKTLFYVHVCGADLSGNGRTKITKKSSHR